MRQFFAGLILFGALLGGPAVAQEAAAAAAPEVTPEQQKQITRLEARIRGLLARVQAIDAELEKLPPDPPGTVAPGVVGPGQVEPGMAPPAGGEPAVGPDGLPMEGDPTMAVPMTRRQRLEAEKTAALTEVFKLQNEIRGIRNEATSNPLDDDNVPELHPMVLYGGKLTANPFGLQVGSWGSGVVEESDTGLLDGLKSLLVYASGYYSGAKFDFATPPELDRYFGDPDRAYLEMDIVFFPEKQATAGVEGGLEGMPDDPGMMDPAMEGAPAGDMADPMMAPAMPGDAMPGGQMNPDGFPPAEGGSLDPAMEPGMMEPGSGMPTAAAKPGPPATRSLRIVLDTDRGPVVAEDVWFDHLYQVYPGWTRVFVSLKDFKRTEERAPEKLNRIRLFGDTTDAFYLGQLRFVSDEVPIQPAIVGAPTIEVVAGEEFTFESYAEAGLSVLNYTWDFGDGQTEETTVPTAEHIYVKPGEYTVTLTASDADKLKEPGQVTATVVVKAFSEIPRQRPGFGAGAPGMPMP